MATMERLKSGKYRVAWCVIIREGRHKGKKVRGSRTFADRGIARQYRVHKFAWEDAIRAGMIALGTELLEDVAKDFKVHYHTHNTPSTADRLDHVLANVLPHLAADGVVTIGEITTDTIRHLQGHLALVRKRRFKDKEIGKKVGNATINREVSGLSSLMEHAKAKGYITDNPCSAVAALPVPDKPDISVPTPKDIGVLLRYAHGRPRRERRYKLRRPRDRLAWGIALTLHTAVRVSELCGAKCQDIDWRHRVWSVVGKGGKKRRLLLVGPAYHAARRLAAYAQARGSEWLFCTRIGKHTNRHTFAHAVKRKAKAAGIARVTPHTLRHTCGTWLAVAGVPLPVIQTIMGHADIATTRKHYVHLSPGHTDAVLAAMRGRRGGFGSAATKPKRPSRKSGQPQDGGTRDRPATGESSEQNA